MHNINKASDQMTIGHMKILEQIFNKYIFNQFRDLRLTRFWMLSGIAVFLHTIADPFLTYLVVVIYEVGAEANPMLAIPLNHSLEVFILAHTPLWITSVGIISGFAVLFEKSSAEDLEVLVRYGEIVWLGIVLWGIALIGNNLLVLSLAIT